MQSLKLKVIACAIVEDEVRQAAEGSPHSLDISYIDLVDCHERIQEGHQNIQEAIDATVDGGWDGVLIGWGLCGRMVSGVRSRDAQLVLPRAHDCLTLMFGSRQAYTDYFLNNSGTYYLSSGWIRHNMQQGGEMVDQLQMGEFRKEYSDLVEQYGEENAKYLAEVMGSWQNHYNKACLIVQDHDEVNTLSRQATDLIAPKGWTLDIRKGALTLLQKWLHGQWDAEDFLIVPPNHQIAESYDEGILRAESAMDEPLRAG